MTPSEDAPKDAGTPPVDLATAAPADSESTRYHEPPVDADGTHYTTAPGSGGSEPSASPRQIGNYEILGELARGGMGVVYRARELRTGRPVALKMILAGQFATGAAVARFHAEAKAAANLDHPGIVPIYDVGEFDGKPYFTMPLITGGSLNELLRDGPLPPEVAARLVQKVAEAVQYAHDKGVIHRDIKPQNILLQREVASTAKPAGASTMTPNSGAASEASFVGPTPRLTDFGLARAVADESGMTASGEAMGTPSYMPPEQASGQWKQVGPRSDVYSLGAVLYCLVTGRPPFQSASAFETMRQVREQEAAPPRQLNAGVPRDLETICLKSLAKEPGRRYATAGELAAELGRFLCGQPVLARPVGKVERGWRWCKRNPTVASLTAAVVVVLIAGVGIASFFAVAADTAARLANSAAGLAQKKAEDEAEAREAADKARSEAEREKNRAQDQLGRTELALYAGQLAQAQREWKDGNGVRALEILDGTQWNLRDIEFRHLWTRFNSKQTFAGNGTCVAFSPDGKRIFNGGLVRDAETGQELYYLRGHTGQIQNVAFSTDGKRIITGSRGQVDEFKGELLRPGELKVWDAEKGQELFSLKGHTDQVTCVAFSADGKRIISNGGSMAFSSDLKVWDAEKGQELLSLKGHTAAVYSVAFSPDGKRILSGDSHGAVKVWDAEKGQQLLTLKGHTDWVKSVAFSADGKRILSGSADKTVKVWDAEKGQEIFSWGNLGKVHALAFSADGKRIVSGGGEYGKPGEVKVWNVETGQQLLSLQGHTFAVESVAFSADGKRILSGSADKTVKVWDAEKGQDLLSLQGLTGAVRSVAISADGKRIVSGGGGGYDGAFLPLPGEVKVWDAEKGQELLSLKGHTGPVTWVAMSADGKRILSGGAGGFDKDGKGLPGELKVWDAEKGQELLSLQGLTKAVMSVAISADGKRIVSGSDNTVKVWDAEKGQELLSLRGHTGVVTSVAISTDGKRIVSAAYGDKGQEQGRLLSEVKVWDAEKGQELLTLDEEHKFMGNSLALAFSPDGKRIVSGGGGHFGETFEVKVWDVEKGEELLSLKGHTGPVACVAFSANGKRILSGGEDKALKVWDAEKGLELLSLQGHSQAVVSVAISADGRRIVSGSKSTGEPPQPGKPLLPVELKVWDAGKDQEVLSLKGHRGEVFSVAFSVDGKRIVSGSDDKTAKLWDAVTGQELISLKGHRSQVTSVAISADGKRIVSGSDGSVKVWDAEKGQELFSLKGHTGGWGTHAAFSPDAKRILSGGGEYGKPGEVKVWDAENGHEILSLKGHTSTVICVAFSPDGKRILSGSLGESDVQGMPLHLPEVKVWDAENGHEILSLKGLTKAVMCVAISANGKRILSGGDTVKVWDAETGEELLSLKGHTAAVYSVAFSADGKRILSSDKDGAVKVWDAEKGSELLSSGKYLGNVYATAISADGKRIVTALQYGQVKLWDLEAAAKAKSSPE